MNTTTPQNNTSSSSAANTYNSLASEESIQKAKAALEQNGITVFVVENREEAKAKVLELIPKGAEVMTMTSVTNDTIGLTQELNESGNYNPTRSKLYGSAESEKISPREKAALGAAPEYATGSVHAVTETGTVLIASNTGSQLPAYAYGADHVIWTVGTHKIVTDTEKGMKRIYEYVLPLESDRAHKAYGVPGSYVSKILVINKEINPGRLTIVLVKEVLGF
jgi:L-lactate utilization protein LutC